MPAPVRPRRLRPGDLVEVIAPSGPVDPGRLARGCAALRGLGYRVRTGRHVLDRDGYLAGADRDRAADLQRAWCDPAVAAVVCARGGYGAGRLLDHLDWAALAAAPPPVFVGGSDVTALHEAFGARLGVATLFGPMPATAVLGGAEPDPASLAHLAATLREPESVRALGGAGSYSVRPGRARGRTRGGTLSLLAAACGTPEHRPATGAIVLLEDVNEAPYRIDRMLTQLLRAGWFAGVAGVVLGSWTGCGPDDSGDGGRGAGAAVAVLARRLAPLDVPVLAGLPFGHGRPQLTVPLGVPAELVVPAGTGGCTLTVTGPALGPPARR